MLFKTIALLEPYFLDVIIYLFDKYSTSTAIPAFPKTLSAFIAVSRADAIDDVELYAPGLPCHQMKLAPYPNKVTGATGDMAGDGKIIICGGAQKYYSGCTEGLQRHCERNVECVTTDGGTEWCFGARTSNCYTYE